MSSTGSWKRYVVGGLHAGGALGLARRMNRSRFLGATVLLYHRVLPSTAPDDHYVALLGDPTATQLEALIRYLKRWFRFSTPQGCLDRWGRGEELDPYTLLLTFDDGYADMHELLLPILRRCKVPATVFITTGAMSGYVTWFQRFFSALAGTRREELPPFADLAPLPLRTPAQRVAALEAVSALQRRFPATAWDESIDRLCEGLGWDGRIDGERMMDWSRVEELHRSGLVAIGGHTLTHPMLEQCTPEQVRRELFDSAEELRSRLHMDSLPFSYPQGRCPPAEIESLVRQAGYSCAFTGRWARNIRQTPLFRLGREHVPPDDLARASLLLSGLRGRRAAPDLEADSEAALNR